MERPDREVYRGRVNRYKEAMKEWSVDLLFLGFGPDHYYLSGIPMPTYLFTVKAPSDWLCGLWLPQDGDPFLTLSRLFAEGVYGQTWIEDIRVIKGPNERDYDLLQTDQDAWEFFKSAARSVRQPKAIAVADKVWAHAYHSLRQLFPHASFTVTTPSMMDRLRAIKDPLELRLMARAAEICDLALTSTISTIHLGTTERDLAVEVEYQIRRHGGDGYSFAPGIVCVGRGSERNRSILTQNTDLVVAPGTSIAFDFGVLYAGYSSDFGRTIFVDPPDPEALKAYRVITSAVQEALTIVRDNAISPEKICYWFRDFVTSEGFGDWYWYLGLGHGIGLEVHEDPRIRPGFDEPVRTNMCFTLEPKVWRHGHYYVRSEDVIVVGENGSMPLTRSTYEATVI